MVEDKTPGGLSYVEFLVHVHRQIQTKIAWGDRILCFHAIFWYEAMSSFIYLSTAQIWRWPDEKQVNQSTVDEFIVELFMLSILQL